MTTLKGTVIVKGTAAGPAIVSQTPINFTAAHTKLKNLFPGFRSEVRDRHHELFGKKTKGAVLIFPTCIGSTYTGLVLLELMCRNEAPAAMVVKSADPLLVSGAVLAQTWFDRGIPIVECDSDELFSSVKDGDYVEVDGSTGEIRVRA